MHYYREGHRRRGKLPDYRTKNFNHFICRNNNHGKWFLCGSEGTDLQRFCHHMEISKNKYCRCGRTRKNHCEKAWRNDHYRQCGRIKKELPSLYRGQTLVLSAKVSSGRKVSWKSQKSSVATVNSSGKVTAKKHGTAKIRAIVDGVTKECEITVKSPAIKLSRTSATIKKGKTLSLKAEVSSGNTPVWKSSRSSVASVNANGVVTARKTGTCIITVSEDGTKETCHIQVKK